MGIVNSLVYIHLGKQLNKKMHYYNNLAQVCSMIALKILRSILITGPHFRSGKVAEEKLKLSET